jgi:hypothetical protein
MQLSRLAVSRPANTDTYIGREGMSDGCNLTPITLPTAPQPYHAVRNRAHTLLANLNDDTKAKPSVPSRYHIFPPMYKVVDHAGHRGPATPCSQPHASPSAATPCNTNDHVYSHDHLCGGTLCVETMYIVWKYKYIQPRVWVTRAAPHEVISPCVANSRSVCSIKPFWSQRAVQRCTNSANNHCPSSAARQAAVMGNLG